MLDNTDLFIRGAERLTDVVGGIILCILGFLLFLKSDDASATRLEFNSKLAKVILSGKAPGLFFMAFGALIMIVSLLHGGSVTDIRSVNAPAPSAQTTVAVTKCPAVPTCPAQATSSTETTSSFNEMPKVGGGSSSGSSSGGGGGGGGGNMIHRQVMGRQP